MTDNASSSSKKQSLQVNRFVYALYLLLVILLLIKGDIEWAITNLGIALAFDPFDASVTWRHRPVYQKIWLIGHLTVVLAGFVYLISV